MASSPSPESLLVLSRALQAFLVQLESLVVETDSCPGAFVRDRGLSPTGSWQCDLVGAAVSHIFEAFRARWVIARLRDSATGLLRCTASCGLDDSTTSRLCETPLDIEQEAVRSGHAVRVVSLQRNPTYAPLTAAFANTQTLVAVPVGNGSDESEGVIAVAFEETETELAAAIETCEDTAAILGSILSTHRRIETRTAAADNAGGPAPAARPPCLPPGPSALVPRAVSLARGANREGPSDDGYCAVAASRFGDTRLFTARPGIPGIEARWEAVALDAGFRVGCALSGEPSEVIEAINRCRGGDGVNFGGQCRMCCADVSSSGREYRFAGNARHLLYDNCSKVVVEQSDSCALDRSGPVGSHSRRAPLRSGDMVILHTCELPGTLPERHGLLRELGALLARASRRPVEVIAAETAGLLREVCGRGKFEPALVLLRSE